MIDKNELIVRELTEITVRGAREHNLKNISLDIPRDELIVVTGLSGSGKSTLAFDTLYAEGQRRYVECLSQYAKQFIGVMKKPDVDVVEGLSPAISIEQKTISHNPRSTVGTVTEIYDYLRLLFAKIGIRYCDECDVPVLVKTNEQIKQIISEKYNGEKVMLLAPIVRGRKGEYKELFAKLIAQGFTKVRINKEVCSLHSLAQLSRYKTHDIDVLVDRFVIEDTQYHRLSESCDLALKIGDGSMVVSSANSPDKEELFSAHNSCPSCSKSFQSLSPNMFSFNSPYGACTNCNGIGEVSDFFPDTIIVDEDIQLNEGAISFFNHHNYELFSILTNVCEAVKIPMSKKWIDLSPEEQHFLMYEETRYQDKRFPISASKNPKYLTRTFYGLIETLRELRNNSPYVSFKKQFEETMDTRTCSVCNGGRLKKENLNVRIDEKSIFDITSLNIVDCKQFFEKFKKKLSKKDEIISNLVIKEIITRLDFLEKVGLNYISLSRAVKTLSGGETQRIRLASQIGSQLVGVMYVLDEPSIGLHQHDNYKLIDSLKKLRDLGNTVIVVEHDKSMIEESDYIIDLGPGAGIHGGEVVLSTAVKNLKNLKQEDIEKSLTAQYLKNIKSIEVPQSRKQPNGKYISLINAHGNNLKNVTLNLPLGLFVCVTGMSGSGKSSLINHTLFPILSIFYHRSDKKPLPYGSIGGLENIDKVIEIDQSPIGRTPRSNPATYTGLFTQIRDFFTMLPESKVRGYKAGRFSFNVKGGRCEECEGAGLRKIEMNFLPDVYVLCDTCNGQRYNDETLQVKYKGKSIAEVLEMTVEEANEFFSEIPKIKKKLQTLFEVGLGYIKLGQQAPTLSGGEAQRVKLATELSKSSTGKTLYLLDEPTTGLHFEDVRILLKLLHRLVEKGNTVLVIEHNLDVIKTADWVVDIGPIGGEHGGEIIAQGTPEDIVKQKKGYTWKYLAEELKQ